MRRASRKNDAELRRAVCDDNKKVDVTGLLELRAEYNTCHKERITINDLVLSAVAKSS